MHFCVCQLGTGYQDPRSPAFLLRLFTHPKYIHTHTYIHGYIHKYIHIYTCMYLCAYVSWHSILAPTIHSCQIIHTPHTDKYISTLCKIGYAPCIHIHINTHSCHDESRTLSVSVSVSPNGSLSHSSLPLSVGQSLSVAACRCQC
jgi:hypothetical protein